ncbi:extracellular solute-binding protein [Herbiconiux sp. VKM Ac-1786]|uniref:ABC transporter substrate-binding protein n=1 Tax=Herbiconiux sp. VKM Ac-1786 TaxID=2783824 RepID=UPI00188B8BD3|nr:extracellular solute-binding protein [Herbiconiux sp. VKM Ac-1786]MBF4571799.1 extracellular solute-binding protein [Herbiconiux sp. VKM Ac-1786]
MTFKKTIAVAGLAVTALALAGCAGGGSDTASGGDPNTLTIATTSSNQTAMDAVIAAYKEANPELDVTVNYADTEQYQTTLRTQLSSGTAPDVFTAWAGSGNPGAIDILQAAGYLADLSDSPWVDQVQPDVADSLKIDGKTYGLPSKLDAVGAIYNQGTLDGLGLIAPTTWDELLTFCGDVKDAGKVAFSLGAQTPWVTQLIDYALVANTVYADDPEFDQELAAGDATFVGSGWEDAMNQYLEMNEAGCFNENVLGTDVNASYAALNNGDAVAVVQVLASFPQIQSTAAEGTEYGFFALPANDTGTTRIPTGIGVSYALNAKAKNTDAGQAFIDWLGTPEAITTWFEASPGIPAIPTEGVVTNPVISGAEAIIAAGDTAPFPDQSWPSAKVQDAHLTGVQELFSGQKKVEDVLAGLDAAYGSN